MHFCPPQHRPSVEFLTDDALGVLYDQGSDLGTSPLRGVARSSAIGDWSLLCHCLNRRPVSTGLFAATSPVRITPRRLRKAVGLVKAGYQSHRGHRDSGA